MVTPCGLHGLPKDLPALRSCIRQKWMHFYMFSNYVKNVIGQQQLAQAKDDLLNAA
jgi:hypothetical protein